jgi:hypothetical protein
MATVTYSYTPGQAVFVVNAATFGIGKATIVSVQITTDPLVKKYTVQYINSARVSAMVDESMVYPDLATALTAYGALVS